MDKEILKSLILGLKPNDEVQMNFVTDLNQYNGNYRVDSIAKGKGKGGSLILTLTNMENGTKLSQLTYNGKTHNLGTPTSDVIMNIVFGEKMFGSDKESDMAKVFPKDKEAGDQMKELLKPLVKRTTPTKLTIRSAKAPEFDGTWLVKSAKLHAGRAGQVSLDLIDVTNPNRTAEFWSYRHAGVVDEIEEVEETTETTTTSST